jgi:hypothetical protein
VTDSRVSAISVEVVTQPESASRVSAIAIEVITSQDPPLVTNKPAATLLAFRR